MFKYLSLILSGFCLTITTFNQEAYALSASASASWSLNSTGSNDDDGVNATGTYTLGNQNTNCGGTTRSKAQITGSYTSTTNETLSLSQSCSGGTTRVNASSNMKVTGGRRYFDWELDLTATVNRQSGSPSGSAVARGADPQFIGPNTFLNQIFREEVTLAAGSLVFAEDQQDQARTTFSRGSSLLENPFFSIEILALGPSSDAPPPVDAPPPPPAIDAIVTFNPDPSLTFSITASELEQLLENPENGLGTNDGLVEGISFSYEWNYSELVLTSNPTLYGGGESFAQSGTLATAPEPTSSIGLLALGSIGAAATLKHKLQSSKEKS